MNKAQQEYAQRELPLIGELARNPQPIALSEIAACDTIQAAYRLCVRKNAYGLNQDEIASRLGFTGERDSLGSSGDFNVILNNDHYVRRAESKGDKPRRRYINSKLECDLELVCDVDVIGSWRDLYKAQRLDCQRSKAEQLAQIHEEIEKLKQKTRELGGI